MLVGFNLTLLNLTQNSLPETYLQIQVASRIEVEIFFFNGAPCTQQSYRSILNLFCLVEFAESKV